MAKWKWINFGILAVALGWAAVKFGGPVFRGQKESIRKDLATAQQAKAESDARVASIEKRLGNLSGEIEAFRQESKALLAAEGERIRTETARQLEKVSAQTASEIGSLAKAAQAELKAESARLALDIARQKLSQGLTPAEHGELVGRFVEDLRKVGA